MPHKIRKPKIPDAVERLKVKLILFASTIILGIFVVIFFFVYIAIRTYNSAQEDSTNKIIAQNNMQYFFDASEESNLPDYFNEELTYTTRFFVVSKNGTKYEFSLDHIARIDAAAAKDLFDQTCKLKDSKGYIEDYRYLKIENDTKSSIIFLDCSSYEQIQEVVMESILAAFIFMYILLLIVILISARFVIEPIIENYERQKRFITDAGHELKTPVAIIKANIEVLEYKNGKSNWTSTIQNETVRMTTLINDMLTLSRLESENETIVLEDINIGEYLSTEINEFSEIFRKKNICITTDIDKNVVRKMDKKHLHLLFSVLLQNASKYVVDNGEIAIKLCRRGNRTICSFYNDAEIEESFDFEKIFERFYRADSSHNSKTGGHGIGLSIAKQICEKYKFRINAIQVKKGIRFNIYM